MRGRDESLGIARRFAQTHASAVREKRRKPELDCDADCAPAVTLELCGELTRHAVHLCGDCLRIVDVLVKGELHTARLGAPRRSTYRR